MVLSAEPTKQKTRGSERRGITRAVSPKKGGKKKRKCPVAGTSERKKTQRAERSRSKFTFVAVLEGADDEATRGYQCGPHGVLAGGNTSTFSTSLSVAVSLSSSEFIPRRYWLKKARV